MGRILFRFAGLEILAAFVCYQNTPVQHIRRLEMRSSVSEAGRILGIKELQCVGVDIETILYGMAVDVIKRLRLQATSLEEVRINCDSIRWTAGTSMTRNGMPTVLEQVAMVREAVENPNRHEFLRIREAVKVTCLPPSATNTGVFRPLEVMEALERWGEIDDDFDDYY